MINPKQLNLRYNKKWLSLLAFWVGMFVYYVSSDWAFEDNKIVLFEKYGIKVSLQMILAYVIIVWLIPHLLNRGKHLLFTLSGFLAVYMVHIIYTAARCFYLELKYPDSFRQYDFFARLIDFDLYFFNITWFIFPTLILVVIQYYRDQQEMINLKAEKKATELRMLKNQLNPHFLFNTLNNLYTLALKKSDRAPEVIMTLSKILDYMLYQCNDKFVPLSGEVKLLKNYISLEKVRYGKRLDISFDAEVEEEVCIAPLLLLTFVENAFKHGVSQEIKVAKITIQLRANKKEIQFDLQNSKPNHDAINDKQKRKAIGLQNVRKQLALLYPQSATLDIQESGSVYAVHLKLIPDEL